MEQIPKSGSNRHYFRLTSLEGGSVIGVVNHDVEENRCFIYLSRHFSERHLPVPEILAVSDDGSCYLQTDLGRQSLYDALRTGAILEVAIQSVKQPLSPASFASCHIFKLRAPKGSTSNASSRPTCSTSRQPCSI